MFIFRHAKQSKLRLWKNYVQASIGTDETTKNFSGKVRIWFFFFNILKSMHKRIMMFFSKRLLKFWTAMVSLSRWTMDLSKRSSCQAFDLHGKHLRFRKNKKKKTNILIVNIFIFILARPISLTCQPRPRKRVLRSTKCRISSRHASSCERNLLAKK